MSFISYNKRYARQLEIIGSAGQEKLFNSKVTIIGVGGLGTVSATYLAMAGIGELTLIDSDTVSITDLNRQFLYTEEDLGKPKVRIAEKRLRKINSELKINALNEKVTQANVQDIIRGSSIIIDGLDNWQTRIIVNDACVQQGIPFIHGAVEGINGQFMVVYPGKTACLRCIFPERKEERRPPQVLGPAPGVIASLQALEAIKILTGMKTETLGKLYIFEGKSLEIRWFKVNKREDCPVCGGGT